MQIFVTNRAFNMFKIELENRDFRKSLYFYKVDAGEKKKEKKRAASGCWHYIKSRANIKWTLEKYGLQALASALIRMYSGIDAFAVNCVLYLIVCRSR